MACNDQWMDESKIFEGMAGAQPFDLFTDPAIANLHQSLGRSFEGLGVASGFILLRIATRSASSIYLTCGIRDSYTGIRCIKFSVRTER